MGREIRMVIPNWEHPKREDGEYKPLHDESFDITFYAWIKDYELWKTGKHPSQEDYPYWDYAGGPPDPDMCRPEWGEKDAIWVQIYETVSEGTPVTPPFATKDELVDYLVEHGDFWDQKRGTGGWNRANAEKFVACGYAPSMMVCGGKISTPRDGI